MRRADRSIWSSARQWSSLLQMPRVGTLQTDQDRKTVCRTLARYQLRPAVRRPGRERSRMQPSGSGCWRSQWRRAAWPSRDSRVHSLALLLEPGEDVLPWVTDRDRDVRAHAFGSGKRQAPGQHGAPVVSHDVYRGGHAEGGEQAREILEQPVDAVLSTARRGVRVPETPQIRDDGAASRGHEPRDHAAPQAV
jgi:hypothetical protein